MQRMWRYGISFPSMGTKSIEGIYKTLTSFSTVNTTVLTITRCWAELRVLDCLDLTTGSAKDG